MSTVLTKPVLLDETGQAIVGKLDEIKEAIDNGGSEKYPVLIHITSMPSKTSYIAGEQLNLAGMVVKAVFSNNVEYDVTDQCTFSPANGTVLTSSDTSVTATYTWHPTGTSFTATQAITVKGIVGISVATPPTKTDYIINETLDLTGMVVHLDYDDNTYDDITADCTYVPANGATLDDDTLTAVAISYYEPTFATTLTTSQAISVVIPIYGVEWDGTAPTIWTRTDLAADFDDPIPSMSDGAGGYTTGYSPFDNRQPWAGMERVEDSETGLTLVKIPKYYYKLEKVGTGLKLQISMVPLDGFLTSPAHSDRGDGQGERDFIYVGAYSGTSQRGSIPSTNFQVNATLLQNLHNLGSNGEYWGWDYATKVTIHFLYLVEFADWNSQKTIGYGGRNHGAGLQIPANGYTDAIPYHTGTTGTTRDEYPSGVKYRNIEGLWSNIEEWCFGLVNNTEAASGSSYKYHRIYITKNPATMLAMNSSRAYDLTTFTSLGSSWAGGNVTEWNVCTKPGFEFVLIPSVGNNTDYDTYCCDSNGAAVGSTVNTLYGALVGRAQDDLQTGIGYLSLSTVYGNSSTTRGARIMKLPNNT